MITTNAKVLAFLPEHSSTNEKTSVHAIMDGEVLELDKCPLLAPAPRGNSSKYNTGYLGLYIVEENDNKFIIWLNRSTIDQWSRDGAFWVSITQYNQEIVDDFLKSSAKDEMYNFGDFCHGGQKAWCFQGKAWTEIETVNFDLAGWTKFMGVEKNTWLDWLQSQHRKLRLNEEFEVACKSATEAGATVDQIEKIKKSCKGAVVVGLDVLRVCLLSKEEKPLETTVRLISGHKGVVAKNIAMLFMAQVNLDLAGKVARKAQAWVYIQKCIPGVSFQGHFDDALNAIKAYSTGSYTPINGVYTFQGTVGAAQSDFAIKLNKALYDK